MNEDKDSLDQVIKHVFMKMPRPKLEKCPAEENLAAFQKGSLSQAEMEKIEEHLTLCKTCTESLIVFSEAESSLSATDEAPLTEEIILKARNLMKPIEKSSLWEGISSLFPVSRPVPIMVAVSIALIVIIFGIFTIYTPHRPFFKMSPVVKFSLVARIPTGIVFRGIPPEYKEVEIQDGSVLHSGDKFRIEFELQEEAYVYLLVLDSQGNLSRLFPEEDIPIKIQAYETCFFPSGETWMELDHNTGEEKLLLLISREPIEDIDGKTQRLERSGIDEISKIFYEASVQTLSFRHE